MTRVLKIIVIIVFTSALILPEFFISAQNESAEICEISKVEKSCSSSAPSQCRQLLERCDEYYKQEAARVGQDINKTEKEKQTLQNKISGLRSQIKNLEYQIYQSNLMIGDLGVQIKDTESSIEKTSSEIDGIKERLSAILRKINEEDYRSLVEILLSEGLSEFFDDLAAYESLSFETQTLLGDIKSLKSSLEIQKQTQDSDKDDLENTVKIQTLQKQQNTNLKTEQEYYLKLTEAQYQQYLKERKSIEESASQIRARIFELIGVPKAPTFEEAYNIANFVSGQTGVRPALLLAVLYQESSIGKNVGQCYLTDLTTGRGVRTNGAPISNVMKPSRDIQPFLQITKELNRDPINTPVSCPIPSVGGYGGAMGPAQFIPSTWVGYKNRVAAIKGSSPDPWNIADAFLASAVYLSDAGATKKGTTQKIYEYEWCAALSYFAGSCSSSNQIRYEFYGDNVMYWATKFEQDIKAIE